MKEDFQETIIMRHFYSALLASVYLHSICAMFDANFIIRKVGMYWKCLYVFYFFN